MPTPSNSSLWRVHGRVQLGTGKPAPQLPLNIYSHSLKSQRQLLGASRTDDEGSFVFEYPAPAEPVIVELFGVYRGHEARLYGQRDELAQPDLLVDLVATSAPERSPVASHFHQYLALMNKHVTIEQIPGLDARQELLLASATGLAREDVGGMVAAFRCKDATEMPSEAAYALALAKLPVATTAELARVPRSAVGEALRQAARENHIKVNAIDGGLEAFDRVAARERLKARLPGTTSSLAEFVDLAPCSESDRELFRKVVATPSAGKSLWERARRAGIGEETLTRLKLQGRIAYLTLNDAPLTARVVADLLANESTDVLDLIDLDLDDPSQWQERLQALNNATRLPPQVGGSSEEERRAFYCDLLSRRVREMNPDRTLLRDLQRGRLAGVAPELQNEVASHLRQGHDAGLRLGSSPFSARTKAISTQVQATALSIQRLFLLTSDPRVIGLLLANGLSSASTIAELPEKGFVSWFGAKLGSIPDARRLHVAACQRAAATFHIVTERARAESAVPTAVLGPANAAPAVRTFPTLEQLFGTVDFCACEECRSVLGPTAYFVDLLQFVNPNAEVWSGQLSIWNNRNAPLTYAEGGFRQPYAALNDRRPDLKRIPLTCANANTLLPYIDLVNEILEQRVAGRDEAESRDNGEAESADLLAEPQFTLWAAYDKLAKTTYALGLPFDLALETVRALVKPLGTTLWQLRAAHATQTLEGSANRPGLADVWLERLNLSPGDRDVIDSDWWLLYGHSLEQSALNDLRSAKNLSRRLGVSYVDLTELIQTAFVNPGASALATLGRLGLDLQAAALFVKNELKGSALVNFKAELAAIKTRYPAWDDPESWLRDVWSAAVRARTIVIHRDLNSTDFSTATVETAELPSAARVLPDMLRRLNLFVRLRSRLGWSTEELDTALVTAIPSKAGKFEDAMRTALVRFAHLVEVAELGAGRVSREEVAVLWADIPTDGGRSLYRRMFLRPGAASDNVFDAPHDPLLDKSERSLKAHGSAVRQLLQLSDTDRDAVLVHVGEKDANLTVATLSALHRHDVLARVLGLPIPSLLTYLSLTELNPLSPHSNLAITTLTLNAEVPFKQTVPFIREVKNLIALGLDAQGIEAMCRGVSTSDEQKVEEQRRHAAFAAVVASARTGFQPKDAEPKELQQQQEQVRSAQFQTSVVQRLAAEFGTTEALLTSLITDTNLITEPGLKTPLISAALGILVTPGTEHLDLMLTFPAPGAYTFNLPAGKTVQLVVATGAGTSLQPAESNGFVFSDVSAGVLHRATFDTLEGLTIVGPSGLKVELEQLTPVSHESYERFMRSASLVQRILDLCTRFRLGLTELRTLPGGKDVLQKLPLENVATDGKTLYAFLVKLAADRNKSKPSPAAALPVEWAVPETTGALADTVREAVRARWSREAWRSVAEPIFNELRRKRRDALLAFLLNQPNPPYDTAEALYSHLLIDPKMEPAARVTRIGLATASVQQFIRSCMNNLEYEVPSDILDRQRWTWMSRYRMWEANRKMFLWPENWLEPETRDDKTHLFRALEAKLLQADVSTDLVEAGVHEYLKALERIARLDVMTMYYELETQLKDSITHVIARTLTSPFRYFYRSCSHGMWTPWEPLAAEIEGKHLALVKWQDRLHLFWFTFMMKGEPQPQDPNEEVSIADYAKRKPSQVAPKPLVAVQLNWVERSRGTWTDRHSTLFFDAPELETFVSNGALREDDLTVHVLHSPDTDELTIGLGIGNDSLGFKLLTKLSSPVLGKIIGGNAKSVLSAKTPRATKFAGSGPLTVTFIPKAKVAMGSFDGPARSAPILNLDGSASYRVATPTNPLLLGLPSLDPPKPDGPILGYEGAFEHSASIVHLTYRSGGRLYEVYGEGTKDGSDYWYLRDLTETLFGLPGVMTAGHVDALWRNQFGQGVPPRHAYHLVAFVGQDDHLYLGRWVNQPSPGPGTWSKYDITDTTPDTAKPFGTPAIVTALGENYVVYRTTDGFIWSIKLKVDDTRTPSAPIPLQPVKLNPQNGSNPTPLAAGELGRAMNGSDSDSFIYRTEQGDAYLTGARGPTGGVNLSRLPGGVKCKGDPVLIEAYRWMNGAILIALFRAMDDRVVGFSYSGTGGGAWAAIAIPLGIPPAAGPLGTWQYEDDKGYWARAVYRAADGHIHELWEDASGWHHTDLSAEAGPKAPLASGDPAPFMFTRFKKRYIAYVDNAGRLILLSRVLEPLGAWHVDVLRLANRDIQDPGPLVAPFFFEDDRFTFFVQPTLTTTPIDQWEDYVIPASGEIS